MSLVKFGHMEQANKCLQKCQHTCLSERYQVSMRIEQLYSCEADIVRITPRGEYVQLQHEAGGSAHVQVSTVY